jgi:tetratricopeptide (TPR) repeat protein
MKIYRQLCFLLIFLALFCGKIIAISPIAEDKTVPEKEKSITKEHQLHWWERWFTHPYMPTPQEQLVYADNLRAKGKLRKAANEYRALVFAWPDSAEAPIAQFRMSEILKERGKYKRAFDEYQFLIEAYPGAVPSHRVLEDQYKVADTVATNVHRFVFIKWESPEDAIPMFEKIIENGINWTNAPELQFRIARLYEKAGELDMAIDAYALYHQRYPFSDMAEQALFCQARAAYLYAKKYPVSTDLRESAIIKLTAYLDWYPKGNMVQIAKRYLEELEMDMAYTLYKQALLYDKTASYTGDREIKIKNLQSAVVAYRRVVDEFVGSRWADMAASRLANVNIRLKNLTESKK